MWWLTIILLAIVSGNVSSFKRKLAGYSAASSTIPEKNSPQKIIDLYINTPDDKQEDAVNDMIKRLLPSRAKEFMIKVNSSLFEESIEKYSQYQISYYNDKVHIVASDGIAVANGFYYYLKNYGKCIISWSGDQLKLAKPLPIPKNTTIIIKEKLRYYQNVCTQSYSLVWWNWTRWEREIDWMAMNGINMPLMSVGQETIWLEVFREIGLEKSYVDSFFTGPAFLSWNRLGNLKGFAGPLSYNWHKDQLILAKKIIERMKSFGMQVVLPAFSGHVPNRLQILFPNADIKNHSKWSHFDCKYSCVAFLDPRDELFQKIGLEIMRKQTKLFGPNRFYSADLFNEMKPPSRDQDYFSSVGRSMYSMLTQENPDAVWVMQAWMFIHDKFFWNINLGKALVNSVPVNGLILLDLASDLEPLFDKWQGYFGHYFIWCMLQNYGGVLGLYGSIGNINKYIYSSKEKWPNIIGIGLTAEGIEQNDIVYEFIMNTLWNDKPYDLNLWLKDYVERRYGTYDENLFAGLNYLMHSVYNITSPIFKNHGQYELVTTPKFFIKKYPYKINNIYEAWEKFLKIKNPLNMETYNYDLTDITRQSLVFIFREYLINAGRAFASNNRNDFINNTNQIIQVLIDLDQLLLCNKNFLLGRWLEDAKSLAKDEQEKILYEFNARNQISLWGPNGEIKDYATKQWSGVVKDYYLPRWQIFIHYWIESFDKHKKIDFNAFKKKIFNEIELPFTISRKIYPREPQGNCFNISSKLYEKYKYLIHKSNK